MSKKIIIKAEYTFSCQREVTADNYEDAQQQVINSCWCIRPEYHSSLPYNEVDWD
jgi:hypothetical protein